MDNFNTTDMENYAKKIDEKYVDRDADKMGYLGFIDVAKNKISDVKDEIAKLVQHFLIDYTF